MKCPRCGVRNLPTELKTRIKKKKVVKFCGFCGEELKGDGPKWSPGRFIKKLFKESNDAEEEEAFKCMYEYKYGRRCGVDSVATIYQRGWPYRYCEPHARLESKKTGRKIQWD